jgi:peptide-methionine (S)-S-oxide reductase
MSLMDLINKKSLLPSESEALQGRAEEVEVPDEHFLKGTPIKGPYPEGLDQAIFGMGCFWGVEKKFWLLDGVYTTAVGYSGGFTKNPTYREVCTGMTGHNEVVLVVFDPKKISYEVLLKTFWEDHDPTQGMQQGNDVGTQYRSGAYVFNQEQRSAATDSLTSYQQNLNKSGFGLITTEIEPVGSFYFAEHYHQHYLAKNPDGYCGVDGTGIEFN